MDREPWDSRDEAENDPVEELLALCLALPPEDRPEAFRNCCEQHPELADALRERFAALRAMGLLEEEDLSVQRPTPRTLGPYQLGATLGRGGMGIVHLAWDATLQREVAVKLVRPDRLDSERARARFHREVRLLAALSNDHIVPVHAFGEDEGIPWFAMDYVRGLTLANVLERLKDRAPESLRAEDFAWVLAESLEEPIDFEKGERFQGAWWRIVVALVVQVAHALEHAHSRGLVHRDVKSSNVIVTREGRALLFDFGLARSYRSELLTREGTVLGSLAYLAPEAFLDPSRADERSDVYGLGVTLYELLCGRLPYVADSEVELRALVLQGDLPSPRVRNPAIPDALEWVCRKALARRPEGRYASAHAFRQDLEALLEGRRTVARPRGRIEILRASLRRHRPTLGLIALIWLSLLLVPSLLLERRQRLNREREEARDALRVARERSEEARSRGDRLDAFLLALFEHGDPAVTSDRWLTSRELVRRGLDRVSESFEGSADERRELGWLLVDLAREVGEEREAFLLGEAWVEQDPLESERARVAERRGRLAWARLAIDAGLPERAEVCLAKGWPTVAGTPDESIWFAERSLALALQARFEEASALLRDARRTRGTNDLLKVAERRIERIRDRIAGNRTDLVGRERELRDRVESLARHSDLEDPDFARELAALGETLAQGGRTEDARRVFTAWLRLERRRSSEDSLGVARALAARARVQDDAGDPESAERDLREALRIAALNHPDDHPQRIAWHVDLARTLVRQLRWSEAHTHLSACRAKLERSAPDSLLLGEVLEELARCHGTRLAFVPALEATRRAADLYERHLGKDAPRLARLEVRLASLLLALDRAPEEIERRLAHAEKVFSRYEEHLPQRAWIHQTRGLARARFGRFEEATSDFAALRSVLARLGQDEWLIGDAERWEAWTTFQEGRVDASIGLHEKALERLERTLGVDSHHALQTRHQLALVLSAADRHADAHAIAATIPEEFEPEALPERE